MIRWLSSVTGSVSVTTTCSLLAYALVAPGVGTTPASRLVSIAPEAPAPLLSVRNRTVSNVRIKVVEIDLNNPDTLISVGLANGARQANTARSTRGAESFRSLVRRHRAAITINGTFFSMDSQKRVMGNMVSGGQFLKYSPSENYGTTLGILSGNRLEMITARIDGKPQWQRHWFSITAGPRLLRDGRISINPRQEGFRDPAIFGVAKRSAIGFPNTGDRLLLVTFPQPITLLKEAQIMRSLGCDHAMNLDGGTSVALAAGDRILHAPGRPLTNVITVYDARFPAPEWLRRSWQEFQTRE